MRIAVVGGGLSGLYFSILMRKVRPDWEVCVFERNRPGDAFGFGVVFSDETLSVFEHADPETYWAITERFARWTDIDIHYRGSVTRSGGHGFAALGRRELLAILQERALELGAEIRFRDRGPGGVRARLGRRGRGRGWGLERDPDGAGGPVRADAGPAVLPVHVAGHGPRVRRLQVLHGRYAPRGVPGPRVSVRRPDEHVHRRDATSRRGASRLDRCAEPLPPGVSDERSIALRELFADVLDGHELVANNSTWINFVTVRNAPGARATSSCSATRRTRRTSRSARGRSWRWRTRSRSPGRCARGEDVERRSTPTRTSAGRSSRARSARRRARSSGSRGSGATSSQDRCSSRSTC